MSRALLVLSLLVGCTADGGADDSGVADTGTAEPFTPEHPYDAAGPWSAGTVDDALTGSTGVDFKVQVWFPTDDTDGDTVSYDSLFPGTALDDATPACDGARPVVLFSHGYGAVRWQSPELVEYWATHGHVVVAPDHTGNTFADNDDDRFYELVERRPQDIADSFDWLVANAADLGLDGCVDESAGYAVAGHSFGGYTAYATAGASVNMDGGAVDLSDDRVWAALPLAPWDASGALTDGTADIAVPVMTLSGTLDETTTWSQVTGLHDALTVEPRYLGEFPTAGHFSFSPLACDLGTSDNGCGDENIDLDTFLGLVNTSALAFFASVQVDPAAIDFKAAESEALIWTAVP